MAKQSVTTIAIEGVQSSPAFSSLSIMQRMDWHHQFELRLPIKNDRVSKDTLRAEAQKYVSKAISIRIRPAGVNQGEELNFKGLIFGAALSRPHGGDNEIVLSGYSPSILLDDGENTRSFSDTTLSRIFEKVTGAYQKDLLNFNRNTPQADKKIPFFVQYKETNYHFLCRLALLYGEWFYYDGTELRLQKPAGNAQRLRYGKDLSQFQIGLRLAPAKFGLSAYHAKSNSALTAAAPGPTFDMKDEYLTLADKSSAALYPYQPLHPAKYYASNQEELNARAEIEKRERDSQMAYASGSGDFTGLHPGSVVEIANDLNGPNVERYGIFVLSNVTHYADAEGQYSNWFEAVPAALKSPPPNPNVRPPVCEIQPAIVMDNHDRNNQGRLRVQFFWQKKGEMTPFIRLVTSSSGKDEGFYFLPEKGEQVMVAFEHNNPNRPFVMGSNYHAGATAGLWSDPGNLLKGIQTRGQNQLLFNDTPKKQQVLLNTQDKKNFLEMKQENDGSITIETGKKMRIEARIKDDGAIEIIARTIHLKAKKDITLETEEGDIIIRAAKDFKVESTSSSMKSKAKTDVNGGGELTMEAGIINLN